MSVADPSSPANSASPSSSPAAILTPSRKVQALLAQFSDSDSEQDIQPVGRGNRTEVKSLKSPSEPPSDTEEEDEEIQPRGRLAARLLGGQHAGVIVEPSEKLSREQLDVPTRASAVEGAGKADDKSSRSDSSEDEIVTAQASLKRVTTGPRIALQEEASGSPARSRSASPLFFPSPSTARKSASPRSSASHHTARSRNSDSNENGRSKFLALVDKHRKERIAREAAEVAKRAAGITDNEKDTPKRVRGSSPADDSSEGNTSADEDAIKRIQKQARPTRKASKKALEEMNRETQRMNRNMQLAHQAKTKKKITKDSLLARFNFTLSGSAPSEPIPRTQCSTASSSAAASDAEDGRAHLSTPPTSPLCEHDTIEADQTLLQVKDLTHLLESGQLTAEVYGALSAEDVPLNPKEITSPSSLSRSMQLLLSYHQNDITVKSPQASKIPPAADNSVFVVRPTFSEAQPVGKRLTRFSAFRQGDSDSDSEIEIVKERGLKRKYAAFETLPKRKAKEMPSHLALRSLAHLLGSDEKKRSINAAELEVDLRQRARKQALEERRQRIEDLKAKGVVIQTAEERERDQQEVEDIVERARQEASEIQRRERDLAKKDGTYVKDNLDDGDDESEDEDFEEDNEGSENSGSEDDIEDADGEKEKADEGLIEDEAQASETENATLSEADDIDAIPEKQVLDQRKQLSRAPRNIRIIQEDEDDEGNQYNASDLQKEDQSPQLPAPIKTPRSAPRSARKMIPGLQMSDDLPMGLSQAFAATMADSQTQDQTATQEQDSFDFAADLPSPNLVPVPPLQRLDSIDIVSDSQPSASQTQPLNVNLTSQIQVVPESPRGLGIRGTQYTPSQRHLPFELTQDNGYILSPFLGNRFAESPNLDGPQSTVETVILPQGLDSSPVLQRKGRLQRGRAQAGISEDDVVQERTAFQLMSLAAKTKAAQEDFNKKKSEARNIVDEAAEESEDEYAGLGGASDDSGDDDENDDDRQMIDEDTEIGKGDEAKLAGLFADRERARDEQEVSKLLKDITTGALRRKRGVGDDLDLSDEEDAAARRREAKRREFAKMRKELLKDEAVGKIAEDKKKEAFLRSIEDREAEDEDDDDFDQVEDLPDSASRSQPESQETLIVNSQGGQGGPSMNKHHKQPLDEVPQSRLNRQGTGVLHAKPAYSRKPVTLADIRESVSFLIEEPDSQAAMVDLGLSDSEEEPEAYVDLDRHFKFAEAHENTLDEDNDDEDLGDFVVDDALVTKQNSESDLFKKPELPRQERAPFAERRTKRNDVVDRLSLLRQSSSSASSTTSSTSASTKMAFLSSKAGAGFAGVPTLLRRATTNSSLGSMSGRDNVSATGVVTSKTERGNAGEEKEFIRKGNGGKRNAVNYQADRKTLCEEKMSVRAGIRKNRKGKKGQGFLGGLFRGDSWE